MPVETWDRTLSSLGFGTRRECWSLVRAGLVQWGDEVIEEGDQPIPDNLEALPVVVNGETIDLRRNLYIIMHKPLGLECSHQPSHHESVFSLLPVRYRRMGLQTAGRLDVDTSGLLLLSNDGAFLHAIESPRRGHNKTYRCTLKHDITDQMVESLCRGVRLRHAKKEVNALSIERIDSKTADICIGQGLYHQVKRMWAAVSNRVEGLHRIRIGTLELGELEPRAWRHLEPDEVVKLNATEIL